MGRLKTLFLSSLVATLSLATIDMWTGVYISNNIDNKKELLGHKIILTEKENPDSKLLNSYKADVAQWFEKQPVWTPAINLYQQNKELKKELDLFDALKPHIERTAKFADKKNIELPDIPDKYKQYSINTINNDLKETFTKKKKLTFEETNFLKPRTVNIHSFLYNTTPERMEKLLRKIETEDYKKEFNITFNLASFNKFGEYRQKFDYTPNMFEILDLTPINSEIHILATEGNYRMDFPEEEEGTTIFNTLGMANSLSGFIWVDANLDDNELYHVLRHEIAHLFKAEDIYKTNAVMNWQYQTNTKWTKNTKETILRNKFNRWTDYYGPINTDYFSLTQKIF
ncbi:MAG: hypothetical protein ABIB43_06790 [archaeon]